MFQNIKADFRRYCPEGSDWKSAAVAAVEYGFLATLIYRFGRWGRGVRPRILALPLRVAYAILAKCSDIFFGINISTNAAIGPGLYIGHFGAIFLHGDMGANCSVGQCVTVGFKGAGKSTRPPRIGSNVYIGTSAVVIGDIEIGDNVVIGANTTVVTDVPAGCRVVGAAARVSRIAPARGSPVASADPNE